VLESAGEAIQAAAAELSLALLRSRGRKLRQKGIDDPDSAENRPGL